MDSIVRYRQIGEILGCPGPSDGRARINEFHSSSGKFVGEARDRKDRTRERARDFIPLRHLVALLWRDYKTQLAASQCEIHIVVFPAQISSSPSPLPLPLLPPPPLPPLPPRRSLSLSESHHRLDSPENIVHAGCSRSRISHRGIRIHTCVSWLWSLWSRQFAPKNRDVPGERDVTVRIDVRLHVYRQFSPFKFHFFNAKKILPLIIFQFFFFSCGICVYANRDYLRL